MTLGFIPGAATPTCSSQIPAYLAETEKFKSKNVDAIYVVTVNDAVREYIPLCLLESCPSAPGRFQLFTISWPRRKDYITISKADPPFLDRVHPMLRCPS